MRLNSVQQETLRKRPQQTKLYLSIFQPQAIFKAQVNDATITRGARTITYDSVSLGAFSSIQANMTMWVGTTPGAMDIGKIRVRSATSTVITVSENSNIEWADNLYLTIFYYVELWPVFPRIIQDPADAENVIFYKDYDIAYTDQNSILGTFVNMGPHRAIMLDPATGQAQLCWSSSGTYNLLGHSLTYSWLFGGASGVTGSSSAEPGQITYNTPGHFVTRLTVTDNVNGAIDTSYRYVSIYNQANPPIQKWELERLDGGRDEGGYTASFKVFETIPIQEHAIVVLFYENWYGDEKINLGGNSNCGQNIFFVGHVDKDSIHYDYEHSEVSFDAHSPTMMMKESVGFSISVESVASPTKWYQLLDMDSPRALYHYLRWHTTALQFMDFAFIGDMYKVQFFDSDRESMYDALDNYMRSALIGKVVADRQGKVWMEKQAESYPNPTGSFPSVMSITKRDWMNQPSIEERLSETISYLEYGGVAYSGVNTGTFTPLMASAPGQAPGFHGVAEFQQGMVLEGQSQLNRVVGNLFANRNSPFVSAGFELSENATNLDIAPQETVYVNVLASETVRNIPLQGLFLPASMNWKYDSENFILLPTIDLKQLVSGNIGETIVIPNIDEIGTGWNVPSFDIPPYPNFGSFNSTVPETGDDAPSTVIVHDTTFGLIMTNTFNTDHPTWFTINAGILAGDYPLINKIVVTPSGAIYVARCGGGYSGAGSFLYRASAPGAPFALIEDYASITAKFGHAGTGNGWVGNLDCDYTQGEVVMYALNDQNNFRLYYGTFGSFAAGAIFASGEPNCSVSFGDGKWVLTGNSLAAKMWILDSSASAITGIKSSPDLKSGQVRHRRIGSTGKIYHYQNLSDDTITLSEGNGTTFTPNIGSTYAVSELESDEHANFALDPSGQFICARKQTSNRGKSADGGYTLITIGTLPVGFWWWDNCGTQSRWVSAGAGGYVYYTRDFFSSNPIDKRGDILTINPALNLDNVKVIG